MRVVKKERKKLVRIKKKYKEKRNSSAFHMKSQPENINMKLNFVAYIIKLGYY